MMNYYFIIDLIGYYSDSENETAWPPWLSSVAMASCGGLQEKILAIDRGIHYDGLSKQAACMIQAMPARKGDREVGERMF